MGEPGQQVSLNKGDVTDDRCRAVQQLLNRAKGSGRVAFGQADHRARITDFA